MTLFRALLLSFLVFSDQITKSLARNLAFDRQITDFFTLTHLQHHGVAFSLPLPRFFSILLAVLVSFFLLFRLLKVNMPKTEALGHVFLLGGAVGNLIDRLWLGSVTDFLAFWSFPVFNLADVWINMGVLLILVSEVYKSRIIESK